jgi:hypothetical protein
MKIKWRVEAGRKGGRISAGKRRRLRVGIFAPGVSAKGGKRGGITGGPAGMHSRWHTRRGISNPKCKLCRKMVRKAARL